MTRCGAIVNKIDTVSENLLNNANLSQVTYDSISSDHGSSISGNGYENALERKNTANFGGIEELKDQNNEIILSATVVKSGQISKSSRVINLHGNGDITYTNSKAGLNALFAKKDSHKKI